MIREAPRGHFKLSCYTPGVYAHPIGDGELLASYQGAGELNILEPLGGHRRALGEDKRVGRQYSLSRSSGLLSTQVSVLSIS
jgi:hypothetical protein